MSTPTSASSARNLFIESKARLSDRIQVNVNSTGSLAKQIVRSSKSNEVIIQKYLNNKFIFYSCITLNMVSKKIVI